MNLIERIKVVQEQPPADLLRAFEEVHNHPKSKRLANELVTLAINLIKDRVPSIPLITKMRCLAYHDQNHNFLFGVLRKRTTDGRLTGEEIDFCKGKGPHIIIYRNKLRLLQMADDYLQGKRVSRYELASIEISEKYDPFLYDFAHSFDPREELAITKAEKTKR